MMTTTCLIGLGIVPEVVVTDVRVPVFELVVELVVSIVVVIEVVELAP